MQRKTVIIISCTMGFLLVLILLGVLLFGVKNVYVEAYPSCTDQQRIAVTKSALLIKGKSILFLNEDKLQRKIVEENPNVEILGIERKFPSSVIVHIIPKYACAYLAYGNNYYVLDNDLRILEVKDAKPAEKLIELTTETLYVTEKDIGQVLNTQTRFVPIADATFHALARIGYGVSNEKVNCVDIIERMNIDENPVTDNEVVKFYMRDGAIIEIDRVDELFNEKVQLAVSLYVKDDNYKGSGKYLVAYTKDGKAVVGAKA